MTISSIVAGFVQLFKILIFNHTVTEKNTLPSNIEWSSEAYDKVVAPKIINCQRVIRWQKDKTKV